jgi:hypothetical protein
MNRQGDDPDADDPSVHAILARALDSAIEAFWAHLERGNWDIPVEIEFRASQLDCEYADTIATVVMDNIERARRGQKRTR